jgi:2-methylcitrate dehydratase PrpD
VVALGAACVEAAGLRAARGSMTEAYHAGKAAADGVEAAMLARDGLTGPDDPIGARRGLLALMSADADADRLVDGLGTRWHPAGGPEAPAGGALFTAARSVGALPDLAPLFAAARCA